MESLKKLQAKVSQIKTSATTTLTHKKSLSTSSKSRDGRVRPARSMPLSPVPLDPEIWSNHPRPKYKGKEPLKPADIRVVLKPTEVARALPPYDPHMVVDIEPEDEEYSDEDWYPGPTPPPKDNVFRFPKPPTHIPQPPAASSNTRSLPAVPLDIPVPREDLLPPPPKAIYDSLQRQQEKRRPKSPFGLGPLQPSMSHAEVEDYVSRSEPAMRAVSPTPSTDPRLDRLKDALRRQKEQNGQRQQRPGHLPTPSSSSAGSIPPANIQRSRSANATAALSTGSRPRTPTRDAVSPGLPLGIMSRNHSDSTHRRQQSHSSGSAVAAYPSPPPSIKHRPALSTDRVQLNGTQRQESLDKEPKVVDKPTHQADTSSSSIVLNRSVSSGTSLASSKAARHYPTPSSSSFSSLSDGHHPQPPKKRLPLGAHTISSTFKSTPTIHFMSPADLPIHPPTAGPRRTNTVASRPDRRIPSKKPAGNYF